MSLWFWLESLFFVFFYFPWFFLFVVISLAVMLYCTFRRVSLLSFYVFFESRLIPTLFLILGWGYQPERVQASIYLLFYTLLASLPLLVGSNLNLNPRVIDGLKIFSFGVYKHTVGQ